MQEVRRRVLVVDDEVQVVKALERLLRRAGYDVGVATSGEEALDLLGTFSPDLVLADYRMPGMNGGECLREIARLRPTAARLLLSGYTGQAVGDAVGWAHECLTKPWDSGALLTTLRRHLGEEEA